MLTCVASLLHLSFFLVSLLTVACHCLLSMVAFLAAFYGMAQNLNKWQDFLNNEK